MHLTQRQRIVLIGVLEDERNLTKMPVDSHATTSRLDMGRRRIIIRNAQAGLVPMNLAGWLGRAPTNSDHVLYHREYLRLEGLGLIERYNPHGGRRTTHLKLTPSGRRMAEQLLAKGDDLGGAEAGDMIDWSSVEFEPIEMPPVADEADPWRESAPPEK